MTSMAPSFRATWRPPVGQVAPGNIDINNRPVFFFDNGQYGSEHSFSIGTDQGEVLIPSIVNGKQVSQQEAIDHFLKTGENLGSFKSPDQADAYAEILHNRNQGLGDMPVPMPGRPAALSDLRNRAAPQPMSLIDLARMGGL